MTPLRRLEDPRVLTVISTLLLAAALWIALWAQMSGMDMSAMDGAGGMGAGEMGDGAGGMAMGAGSSGGARMDGAAGMAPPSMSEGAEMGAGGMAGEMAAGAGDMAADGGSSGGMSMNGMGMATDWSARTIIATSAMWLLMMLAMMAPSMAPVMSAYASISSREDRGARLAARIGLFAIGYFALWSVFSVAAALLQLALRDSAAFEMAGTRAGPAAAGALMIAAGLYQLTPVKDACLRHCRSPLAFLLVHWREGMAGAFPVGVRHGAYCVGCCGVFMGLMFVFGTMTLWWMAALAVYFAAEKMAPHAHFWGKVVGVALMFAGGATLFAALARS